MFEFDYLDEVTEQKSDFLVRNFLKDPTGFLHPQELEWDEVLLVDIEDITEVNGELV